MQSHVAPAGNTYPVFYKVKVIVNWLLVAYAVGRAFSPARAPAKRR